MYAVFVFYKIFDYLNMYHTCDFLSNSYIFKYLLFEGGKYIFLTEESNTLQLANVNI